MMEYYTSREKLEVIDMPTGHAHNVVNIGDIDIFTFMWYNKCFDLNKSDTYF